MDMTESEIANELARLKIVAACDDFNLTWTVNSMQKQIMELRQENELLKFRISQLIGGV